jgi:hypothetical protein
MPYCVAQRVTATLGPLSVGVVIGATAVVCVLDADDVVDTADVLVLCCV